jgi:hypothetical protein
MALGFLSHIENGIAKILGEDGNVIDVPATRIPQGLKPGMDFTYRRSKRGNMNIRPPADTSSTEATNSPRARQQYAIKRLMSPGHGPDGKGWSLAQATGIVARGMVESYGHLDTNARNPRDPGTSEGIFQWNGRRKDAMRAFTKKYENKFDGQIDFFDHEVRNSPSERLALIALEKATSPEEAARAMMHFERPQGYTPGNPGRGLGYRQSIKNAQTLMASYDPNYKPSILPSVSGQRELGGGGIAPEDAADLGDMSIDSGDTTVDTEDSSDPSQSTFGSDIESDLSGLGQGGTVDTSGTEANIQGMIQQGYNAQMQGGYLPRLPTINELFGNGQS